MAGTDTYYFGECTWYVAASLAWVRGGWGNATDWPGRAASQGFALTMQPTAGSVVAYAAGDGYSTFGHVAIVREVYGDGRFLVSEMNYVAWDTVDERVSNSYDVEAFILPPGVAPGSGAGALLGGGAATPGAVLPTIAAWDYWRHYFNDVAPDQTNRILGVVGALAGIH